MYFWNRPHKNYKTLEDCCLLPKVNALNKSTTNVVYLFPETKLMGSHTICWKYPVHLYIPTMIVWVIVIECTGKSNAWDATYPCNIVTLANLTLEFFWALGSPLKDHGLNVVSIHNPTQNLYESRQIYESCLCIMSLRPSFYVIYTWCNVCSCTQGYKLNQCYKFVQ